MHGAAWLMQLSQQQSAFQQLICFSTAPSCACKRASILDRSVQDKFHMVTARSPPHPTPRADSIQRLLTKQAPPFSAPPITNTVPSGSRQDQGMTRGAGISSRSQEPLWSVRSVRQLAGLASVSLAQRSVEQPPKIMTCGAAARECAAGACNAVEQGHLRCLGLSWAVPACLSASCIQSSRWGQTCFCPSDYLGPCGALIADRVFGMLAGVRC